MNRSYLHTAAATAMLIAGVATAAQIPANSAYNTDPQDIYVQDDTSQGIANLNMVLCVISSLSPGDMVNAGPYVALVDMNQRKVVDLIDTGVAPVSSDDGAFDEKSVPARPAPALMSPLSSC